ncbi:MAG TPA: hypothetical protein PKD98_03470 [Anaerolineae bacterium]|nr:hypothetical protein [Anaerolineae bacterium]
MKVKAMGLIVLLALLMSIATTTAYAHGVVITYAANERGEIEMDAAFDNGEPLANAQVTIYAPSDPATPYLTAKADENGHYVFTPDQVGRWSVQFRIAGHGDIVHLDIEEVIEPVELRAEVAASEETEADQVQSETEVAVDQSTETTAPENEPAEENVVTVAQNIPADQPNSDAVTSPSTDHSSHSPQAIAETAASSEAPDPAAPARRLVVSSGSSGSTGFTTPQILLMSASVVWGFIGTALYFSSQRKKA